MLPRTRRLPPFRKARAVSRPRPERAVRLALGVFIPTVGEALASAERGRLGFARPRYYDNFIRDHWTLLAIAWDEVGNADGGKAHAAFHEIVRAQSGVSTLRIERQHARDAAEQIVQRASELPPPIREVFFLRGSGLSWDDVQKALPNRVMFSIKDDWEAALQALGKDCKDAIDRLVGPEA